MFIKAVKQLFLYKKIYFIKTNNGDIMMFVYIEDHFFLTKVIYYLKQADIRYTTDSTLPYSSVLLAEINNRTIKLIEENPDKNFIFITYLEENKIFHHFTSVHKRSRSFKNRYHHFFQKCNKLIVSLPYFKDILIRDCHNIDVVPYEIPVINISRNTKDVYQKYDLNKRKKKIMVIDLYYKNLKYIDSLANKYSKIEFIYVGYQPNYLLTKKEQLILRKLPDNIIFVSYFDKNIFSDLCKVSFMVIDFDSYLLDRDYLYMILVFKKHLLLFDNLLYKNLLIPSKHCYFFDTVESLILRIDKVINERVMNLTGIGYDLIKEFTLEQIIKKYRESLK